MSIWIKPNGNEIEINENSFEYAHSLGWKEKGAKKEEKKEVKKPAKKAGK